MLFRHYVICFGICVAVPLCAPAEGKLVRLSYNNPGLVVDLGVGLWAWPLPIDYDRDGDMDLVVSCPDVPFNGTYLFENRDGNVPFPTFEPPVRIGPGYRNVRPSYVGDSVRVLLPAHELLGFSAMKRIYPTEQISAGKIRANQWSLCDYDGDGDLDIVVGVGDWSEYGWDNAFDSTGQWTNGPLHGRVYWIPNLGTDASPQYGDPHAVLAGGEPVDVFGMPSPNFADFDGDGDLDLLCGEFLDRFTYFENIGTRRAPRYARGRFLRYRGQILRMDLEMIVPVAVDWDGDGDVDLVVGQEDGRVALLENTGRIDGLPQFLPPRFFRQKTQFVKFGALVTPCSFDWDGDGDEDLICGNTAGYIGFIENLDGGCPPRWAAPRYLEADGKVIRIQAGYNGSIQGPCEAKWGYTVPSVTDWDGDGLPDIVINSIWGKVMWFRNVGTRTQPHLRGPFPVQVDWPGAVPKPPWVWWKPDPGQLVTQWRTSACALDWDGDGLTDLLTLDHEGYLALFRRVQRDGKLSLLPGDRLFWSPGPSVYGGRHRVRDQGPGLLRLNDGFAGRSGRRKFCAVDWDGDGDRDLLVDSESINLLENVGLRDGKVVLSDAGPLVPDRLAGHSTCPTTVDWNGDGLPDLLIGAEDGHLYYLERDSANP